MKPPFDPRTIVAVRPASAIAARPRLFAALEAAFTVSFSPTLDGAQALIDVGAENAMASQVDLTRSGLPTLTIGPEPGSGAGAEQVLLGDSEFVDQRVRGIQVRDVGVGQHLGAVDRSVEVLATVGRGPVWTVSTGQGPIHRVRSALPELGPDQALRELFAEQALAAVALVHFLRALATPDSHSPPPLRATFLFDDPNLRWRTYGFIDFERLRRHADEHGYHAAMAMIPLDGWRQHRSTVELFRRNPERLSLTLHGNNHVANELTRPMDEASAVAIAAQAIRRARRFESRYGLSMDRVMIPPHGMCSGSVARALGRLDFDALCAIHPYPWTKDPPADRPLAGWEPAEFASGCAVIPRIPFTAPFTEIAIRAFLGHPLVLYGHHDDLADGLDPLAETASRVNRLGEVEWLSLSRIAVTNHAIRREGGVIRVRPYSHRLRVDVPPGADSLVVEEPRNGGDDLTGWSVDGSPSVPFGEAIHHYRGTAEIRLSSPSGIDPESVPPPNRRVWPLVRRAATETRDRLRPLVEMSSQ